MILVKLDSNNLVVELTDAIDVRDYRGYMIAPPGAAKYWRWNGDSFEDTDQAKSWRVQQVADDAAEAALVASQARATAFAVNVGKRARSSGRTIEELVLRAQVDAIRRTDEKEWTDAERDLVAAAEAVDRQADETAVAADAFPVKP